MRAGACRVIGVLGAEWPRIAAAALLASTTVATSLALMGASAWLITMASFHPSIAALQLSIVGVRAFGLARGLSRYAERLLTHDVTLRVMARLQLEVFGRLAQLPIGPRLGAASGEALSRLTADLDTLEHAYTRIAGPAVTSVAIGAALVVTVALIFGPAAPVLAAGLLVGGAVLPGLVWWQSRSAHASLLRHRTTLQRLAVDTVQGAADLLALGAEPRASAAIVDAADGVAAAERRLARLGAASAIAPALAMDLATIGVAGLGAAAVVAGALAPVPYAVVVLLVAASGEIIALVPAAWQALSSTEAAAARIWPRPETNRRLPVAPAPAERRASGDQPPRGVMLRGVSFTYPDARTPSVDAVDLDVAPGRLVAVVGDSGAGKSTLLQLILRFWPTERGEIRLDDVPLDDWAETALRARVAWMGQRAHIIAGTVRDTLTLASPALADDRLWATLAKVGMDETVRGWPQGLDTWIGELGTTISGGERQRLALARVLLVESEVILLDEPTSQVDVDTARLVSDTISELATTRAVLLVTHKASELRAADEIVVLMNGRVVERGRFAELAARPGGRFRAQLVREFGEWAAGPPA